MKILKSFKELLLPGNMDAALREMGFLTPTPVQAEAIPPTRMGKDVLATAQTGTGKTAAFIIPTLASLYGSPGKQLLVLVPTRELASQIAKVIRRVSKGSHLSVALVVGGESFGRQARELKAVPDAIVATPGRLNDHLSGGTADLASVQIVVLDEVDRMLDMGFLPQVEQILQGVPKRRQTLFYSATLPSEMTQLATRFLRKPVRIAIGTGKEGPQISERTVRSSDEEKDRLFLEELDRSSGRILVFVRTQARAERLARLVGRQGRPVVVLHGARTHAQRKEALNRFREGTYPIMIATDIAGRGIDVADIQQVINYDMPASREDYIHRIGRTGRIGKTGSAVNFVTPNTIGTEQTILRTSRKASGAAKMGFRRG